MRATYSFSRNFENCLSKENRDAPCLLLFLYFFSVLGSFYAVLNPFSAKFSSKPSFYYVARRCHLHASKILTGCPYGIFVSLDSHSWRQEYIRLPSYICIIFFFPISGERDILPINRYQRILSIFIEKQKEISIDGTISQRVC